MSEMIKGCLGFKGEKGDPGEIQIADIVDDLNSDSATKPLSAKQGKVLADTKADKTELTSEATTRQSADNNLQTQINGLASGSPKGSYATVSDLTTDNPATGVYVIQADGHLYSWTKDGESAIDLGVYQSTAPTEGYDEIIGQYGLIIDEVFVNDSHINTKYYLKKGETYKVRNLSTGVPVNFYIEGDTSNYIRTSESIQNFIPSRNGYITLYNGTFTSGDKVKIEIENGLRKDFNELEYNGKIEKIMLNRSLENIMIENDSIEGKYINQNKTIDTASVANIHIYDLDAGKYIAIGFGNRNVCTAALDENNNVIKVFDGFSKDSSFKYNYISLNLESNTKIGVSNWENQNNLYFKKPIVFKIENDSVLEKSIFNNFLKLFPSVTSITEESGYLSKTGEVVESNTWRHFVTNCEPNTAYTIRNAAFYLVQWLSDNTVIYTRLDDADSQYSFITASNCIKFGVSYRSLKNDYWKTDEPSDFFNDFLQKEKNKYYERKLSSESSFVYNEPAINGNKRELNDKLYNIGKYPLTPIWGGEYLASWYNKLFSENNVIIDFEGDSITQGEDGGFREKCIEKIMKIGGYTSSDFSIINNGKGGRSTNEWVGTGNYYYQESDATDYPNGILHSGMQNTPDLLICGYGINDAIAGFDDGLTAQQRLEMFETNYREALNRIRGNQAINGRPAYNRSAEDLAIILCMPINGNPQNNAKSQAREHNNWHVYIKPVLQKLCREYQCAFCDFDMMTYDLKWSPNNIWGSTTQPPAYLHPNKAFNLYYASILQQLVLPMGLWKID